MEKQAKKASVGTAALPLQPQNFLAGASQKPCKVLVELSADRLDSLFTSLFTSIRTLSASVEKLVTENNGLRDEVKQLSARVDNNGHQLAFRLTRLETHMQTTTGITLQPIFTCFPKLPVELRVSLCSSRGNHNALTLCAIGQDLGLHTHVSKNSRNRHGREGASFGL